MPGDCEVVDLCPRCGSPGTRLIDRRGDREYIYYIHYVDGRRTKHYIGPADGYIHAERILEIGLTNIEDMNFAELIVNAVRRYVEGRVLAEWKAHGGRAAADEKRRLSQTLQRIAAWMDRLARRLELESQAENQINTSSTVSEDTYTILQTAYREEEEALRRVDEAIEWQHTVRKTNHTDRKTNKLDIYSNQIETKTNREG